MLGLRGAHEVIDTFGHVLDAVIQTGLFCEADSYYDFLCQGKKHESGPRVTDTIATNGLGEAGCVPVAHSYARATRRARDLHRSRAANPTMENMLSTVRSVTCGLRHARASVVLRFLAL